MKAKSYCSTLLIIMIICFSTASIRGQGDTFTTVFNVDLSDAPSFNPGNDIVYITGSMLGWAEPGTQPASQTMSRVGESMVWTITMQLPAGEIQYKYFLNAGWMNGEWGGDPNRVFNVNENSTINDVWAIYQPIVSNWVTFNVDMSPAFGFDPENDLVYLTGSMFGWAMPGTQPENQLMVRQGSTMIWSKTVQMPLGSNQYKYFINYGWGRGEWLDLRSRWINVTEDVTLNDYWAGCEPIVLPYIEDFENSIHGQAPDCWFANGGGTGYGIMGDEDYGSASQKSLRIYHNPDSYVLAITPRLDFDLSTLQITFKTVLTYAIQQHADLYLGTMSDPNDPSTFNQLTAFTLTRRTHQPWHEFHYYLNEAPNNHSYIAFKLGGLDNPFWTAANMDDIEISYIPACPAPHLLSATNITLNGATLSWQQLGTLSAWDIAIGHPGFDPALEGNLVQGLLLPSYEATGLNHSTYYEFYVRHYCEGSASEWSSAGLFRTACGDISLSFVSPLENEIFNTNQTSTIPVEFDFVGCEEFGIQVHLVNTLLNSVTPIDWFQINATGSYSLTIPIPNAICTGSYAINIGYWDNVSNNWMNHYSAFFDIINDENKLEVSQPWQNQTLLTGRNHGISWNSSTNEPVNIYYSIDNGINWNIIMQNVGSSCGTNPWGHNHYGWLVPVTIEGTFNESLIKVVQSNNPEISSVSLPFRITSVMPIDITNPQSGEIFLTGEDIELVFNSLESSWVDIYFVDRFGGSILLESFEATVGVHNRTYSTTNFVEDYGLRFRIHHHITGFGFDSPFFAILSDVPTCVEPVNVQAGNITPNSADISWIVFLNPSSWNLEWGVNNFEQGAGNLITGIDTNPYILSSLPEGSNIHFYLQSVCDEGVASDWAGPFSFITGCGNIEVPFFENFDAVAPNQALACWTRWGNGNTNVVDFLSYSSPHSVHFQSQPFGLRMLVTPQINANLTDIRVKFKALPEHYLLQNTIEVGTVPEPGQPDLFTLVGQFGISGMPGHPWISVDVPFTDYAGSDKYIAIRFLNTHDQWQAFYLDDFQIEYLPVCSEPHNLLASGITLNSADLSWQQSGVSAQYDLIYGPNGFDPATEGTLIQGLLLPSYQATDLNHSTYYAFYVRRYCEGSASEWSSAGLFRTACGDRSLSFVSPLENEVYNTNQTSTIPVEFDFVGCEEFGIQVHLVNTLFNSVTPVDWFQINATGSYSLTIPIPNAICSGSYAINIGYWDNVSNNWMNHYSAFFNIINDENKLEVRQPWQNQTIPTGRNIDIRWNSSTDEPVNIYYSLNNGANWHFIMQNVTSNCGTVIWGHNWYNWQVPANIHGTYNESRIKISSLENPLVYSISEPFIIKSEHPLTFIQPIEGDIVPLGGDLDLVFSVTEPSGMNIYIINPIVGGQYLGYYDAIAGVHTITYNTSGWTEGLDYYFGIWHQNGQMFLNGPCFAIIEGVPGCLPPGNIQITNQLPTSVDISWLNYGGCALWEMEWGNNFFNPGEGTLLSNIGQNHTSLSGLTPGSAYTFYLASICDGGTRSEWVGPFWFSTPSHYVITAFTGENGSVSPLGLVDVLPGEDQSFIIEPNYGYETEDVLIDGISIGAVNAYNFTNVSANYSIEASFSQLTYTITAMAGSGGTITPAGSLVVNHGASQIFTIAANTGYEVTDVLVDGVSVGAISTYTFENVTTNHSISVSFNLLTFSITASAAENGTISPSGNVYVNYGQNQNFTITPNAGFEIADVVVDGLSLGAISTYTFENVTANHSISVSFNILISTITASAGANGSISPSGNVHVFNGQNQTFTITPDTGYEIANVFVDGISVGAVSEYTFENVITNHSISVSFNILTYTITAIAGPNGSISPSGIVNISYGQNQTFAITPDTGYEIADVLVDGLSVGAIGSYTFASVTSNHSILVSFNILTYTITASAGPNGSISPNGDIVLLHGQHQQFVMTPNEGHYLSALLIDGLAVAPALTYTFSNVTSSHSIYAEFAIYMYSLNYAAGANGSLLGDLQQLVQHGSNGSEVLAVPAEGYHFTGWSDGLLDNPRRDLNVTSSLMVTANFSINTYMLTATTGLHGSISPHGNIMIEHGQHQQFVMTPNEGYYLSTLLINGLAVAPVSTYTFSNVTSSHSIHAEFAIYMYSLNYAAGANGSLLGDAQQMVQHGSNGSEVLAVPAEGYHFTGWSDGLMDNPRRDLNVTSSLMVTANFSINTYMLTATTGLHGGISPHGNIMIEHGQHQQFVMTPNEGYYLSTLLINGLAVVPVNTYTFSNVTSSHSIHSEFAIYVYSLNYAAGANGSLLGDAQQMVQHGSNGSEVLAVPAEGYHFTGWSDGLLDNPRRDLNVTSSLMVTANFAPFYRLSGKMAFFNEVETLIPSNFPNSGFFVQLADDDGPVSNARPVIQGHYSFDGLVPGKAYNLRVWEHSVSGLIEDVWTWNNWSSVTSLDALIIGYMVIGNPQVTVFPWILPTPSSEYTPFYAALADINNSGSHTSLDALMLMYRIVGASGSVPFYGGRHNFQLAGSSMVSPSAKRFPVAPDRLFTAFGHYQAQNQANLVYHEITVPTIELGDNFFNIYFAATGDMNASLDPSLQKSIAAMQYDGSIQAKAGDILLYPLSITNDVDLKAFTLFLSYNPQLVEVLSVEGIEIFAIHPKAAKVNIAWFDVNGKSFGKQKPLGWLRVRILQDIELGTRVFEWLAASDLIAVNSNDQEDLLLKGPYIGFDKSEHPAISHQIYPNPFTHETTLRIMLTHKANVQVQIYNQFGQLIKVFDNQSVQAGEHIVRLNQTDFGGSGTYVYKLDVETDFARQSSRGLLILLK